MPDPRLFTCVGVQAPVCAGLRAPLRAPGGCAHPGAGLRASQHHPQAGPELGPAAARRRQAPCSRSYVFTTLYTLLCMHASWPLACRVTAYISCATPPGTPRQQRASPCPSRGAGCNISPHAETPANERSTWSAAETPTPARPPPAGGSQPAVITRTAPCLLPEMSHVSALPWAPAPLACHFSTASSSRIHACSEKE